MEPLYEMAGDRPLVLENNMHALAAWWLLMHQAESDEDVLLVSIMDGQMGAALLIDGRPNRGCATGANEIGHMRFFVDTETCYCGHPGCLERVVSTEFMKQPAKELSMPAARWKITATPAEARAQSSADSRLPSTSSTAALPEPAGDDAVRSVLRLPDGRTKQRT